MKPSEPWGDHLRRLRQEFDCSFSHATPAAREIGPAMLLIRCNETDCAVALEDVALVQSGAQITPATSAEPGFVGLCGLRGALVAVFDLSVTLGWSRAPSNGGWLLRATGSGVAFTFDALLAQTAVAVSMPQPHAPLPSEALTSSLRLPDGSTLVQLHVRELVRQLHANVAPRSGATHLIA